MKNELKSICVIKSRYRARVRERESATSSHVIKNSSSQRSQNVIHLFTNEQRTCSLTLWTSSYIFLLHFLLWWNWAAQQLKINICSLFLCRLIHRSRSRSRSRSREYRTRSRSYSRSPKRSAKSPKRSRSPRRPDSRGVSKSPRMRDMSRSKSKTVDRSKSRSVANRSPSRDSRSHSRNGDD